MATPKGTRAQRFVLNSGEGVHDYTGLLSLPTC